MRVLKFDKMLKYFKNCVSIIFCARKKDPNILTDFYMKTFRVIQMPGRTLHIGKCFTINAMRMICFSFLFFSFAILSENIQKKCN